MLQQREERSLRCVGLADVHRMGETGTRVREPQRSCQCPGIRKDSAGETQGSGKEERGTIVASGRAGGCLQVPWPWPHWPASSWGS